MEILIGILIGALLFCLVMCIKYKVNPFAAIADFMRCLFY